MTELYNLLPVGQANAIGIEKVSELWNMSDRLARNTMKVLTMKYHLPVINLFNGYFRPETAEEIDSYLKISLKYKKSHERKCYHLQRCKDEFNNQTMEYTKLA